MSKSNVFSPDYATARQRFRETASHLGWQLEAHNVGVTGPAGDELMLDVAYSQGGDPGNVLVVSSGVRWPMIDGFQAGLFYAARTGAFSASSGER